MIEFLDQILGSCAGTTHEATKLPRAARQHVGQRKRNNLICEKKAAPCVLAASETVSDLPDEYNDEIGDERYRDASWLYERQSRSGPGTAARAGDCPALLRFNAPTAHGEGLAAFPQKTRRPI